FEARLRIRSSNFTGSRTGYYFFIFDSSNRGPNYVIQLASNGFSLGPDAQPFISRQLAGDFHTYRLHVVAGQADFFIDDQNVASGIPPNPGAPGEGFTLAFGPVAGMSSSNTD